MTEYDEGVFTGFQSYCIAGEFPVKPNGKKRRPCSSSDALSVYEKETPTGEVYYDAVCYSCRQGFSAQEVHKSSLAKELGINPEDGVVTERVNFSNKAEKRERITKSERMDLWNRTGGQKGNSGKKYRSISNWAYNFYGFRFEYDENGNIKAVYFPETREGKLMGYKSRHHPKNFGYGNLGITGSSNDLSGQCRFKNGGGRYALIVGGEFDMAAAQDMLRNYQEQKNQTDYNPYTVVSPTAGEPSAVKQCQRNYEWFDTHDIIVIGMDNDEVGNEVALELAEVLPREKVRIAKWSAKDPNNMLEKGLQKQFWSDFFGAKEFIPSGITSSVNLMDSIKDALKRPRIPLPSFMHKLQAMTKGDGLIQNRIYNIVGDTSVGKSSIINTISHTLFFEDGVKPGIVSLEASDGEYGADLLSYHLSTNLYWLDEEDALAYLDDPDVIKEAHKMLVDEFGESRFHVLDDRSGTFEGLKRRIEQLHRQYGCNVIINDVLTDPLRTMGNEEQAAVLNWMSNFVKNGVTIINVLHTRKPPNDRSGVPKKPTEYDVLGSSIFVQKAAGNIVIYRNKNLTNDPIEQNTTYFDVPKMRQGATGDKVMALYYDGETRRLYDREDYFKEFPEKLPTGYDLSVSSFDKAYWEEGGRGWDGVTKSDNRNTKQSKKRPNNTSTADFMDGVDL